MSYEKYFRHNFCADSAWNDLSPSLLMFKQFRGIINKVELFCNLEWITNKYPLLFYL